MCIPIEICHEISTCDGYDGEFVWDLLKESIACEITYYGPSRSPTTSWNPTVLPTHANNIIEFGRISDGNRSDRRSKKKSYKAKLE